MSSLASFLLARLSEDEWWAREASRLRGQAGTPAGDHWQWVDPDDDSVLVLDPSQYEFVGSEFGGVSVSLRSRELYPSRVVGDLPNFAACSAEGVPTTVGGHIVRHDPARVLAEVASKRRIVEQCTRAEISDSGDTTALNLADAILRHLAAVYDGHPDYDQAWKP